jgi:2-polyprenyl-6-methoxyphenol hydroxylase-like FAD-dependent oxidoreductase
MKEEPPPTVMIVGAGLGGLTLAILLQRAGIEYQLFEKITEIKPFGTPHLPLLPYILSTFSLHGSMRRSMVD